MGATQRTIIIGDIHGCWPELQDLLRATKVKPDDHLVSVGDLTCKGPDSASVLDWAIGAENLDCVLGNHEDRLLRAWRDHTPAHDPLTFAKLNAKRDQYLPFLASLPLYLKGPGYIAVHAGIDPQIARLEDQPRKILTRVRELNGNPWYEGYTGSELIIFGHWAKSEPVVRANVIGLDTSCVYGGRLTAVILPERRLVSVPARRAYAPKASWPK